MDRSTTLGLRFDGKRTPQQFEPFLHADEAQTSVFLGPLYVKARARIPNRKMNLAGRSPQLHFKVRNPAMLRGVMERFLQNPEETERNVRRRWAWQIVSFEVDLHFLLLCEFATEASHGDGNTQVLQF